MVMSPGGWSSEVVGLVRDARAELGAAAAIDWAGPTAERCADVLNRAGTQVADLGRAAEHTEAAVWHHLRAVELARAGAGG